ncbi:hypothetical protein PsYK624_115010 [Phanerochaete sordida]|uniref:F-box domain-containing protein n=1 Tax=Phanerochaete sordida TaxID=48140 RepID=A0A9P3GGR5_9APHY|nr:hypothetical protein PsYK624_115010 [Phanerochaete sordida]
MRNIPRVLPQELVDLIIDNVADAEGSVYVTLSSCRLVCRSWEARAALYLLKRVSVLAPKFEAFLRLAKTSERIRTFTEELSILGVTAHLFGQWSELFSVLPKLSSLEIWNVLVTPTEPDSSDTAIHVHTLANFKLYCINLDTLRLFLRPFSYVETLSLRSEPLWHTVAGEQTAAQPQIRPLPVGRLILENCCDFATLRVLREILRPTAVVANEILRRNFGAVDAFLKSAGSGVEELELHPAREDAPAGLAEVLLPWERARPADFQGLGSCAKLRFLELDIINVSWGGSLFKGVLLHLPEGIERVRIKLAFSQWDCALGVISLHFGARPTRYAKFASLELCGLCEGLLPDDEQQRLRKLQAEVQGSLQPRYGPVTKIMP